MKSIGLLTVLSMVVAVAYLPAEQGAKETGSASEGTCGSCPASAQLTAKSCEGCPSTKLTSSGDAKSCEGCPSTKLTSSGEAKSCEGCPSTKLTSSGDAKSCEGCPSTKLTSSGEAKSCEGCPSTKLTSSGEAKSCEGCPSTKLTSSGEAKCCEGECPSTKLTSSGEATCTANCSDEKCTTCTAAKTCSGDCGADCSNCPITAAMAKLPQMTYVVGEQKVCCPKAAGELAKKSDEKLHYVVAEKTYDCPDEAKKALVTTTEQFVAAFAEPKTCEKSGDITVAGHKACCAGTAAMMAETAKSAMNEVKMSYTVGEKSCHCPVEAEALAKDSGDVKLFVVGEEKTACNVTARLNLARAKYKAAVVALMKADSQTQETSSDS